MTNSESADHYTVLDLWHPESGGKAVDQNEIKSAYRRALLRNHPDKGRGRQVEQLEQPQYTIDEVTEAYNILVNPSTRLQYDETLKIKRRGKNDKNVENHEGVEAIDLDDLLSNAVLKFVAETNSDDSDGFGQASGSSSEWFGIGLPKGYDDVTDQVDVKGLDLLNSDSGFGNARTLFDTSKPSALINGKGKANPRGDEVKKDWVESDTDEQLMLFIPFQSTLKVHTLHITSLCPSRASAEEDDPPMRPKTIQLYTNRAHILGFEEAEDIPATQSILLQPQDWDSTTGTAKFELRFVKFQNVSSLVVFVLDGDGEGEKVRIDRLRIIGERGEKRELGKLEKIGDEVGE
ncbi:MAG: hypothetical protein LQ352_000729 [Teloschistes flavicans]|nr:MAG: hypothetical protein LQ352_000729 [Teloschistes flavicans]